MGDLRTGVLAVGAQSVCRDFLRGKGGYYVYILRRPDGRPFYVGKGWGDRVFQHENEARHPNGRRSNHYKLNVIRSIARANSTILYEIDFVSDDEMAAYLREAELITHFKRLHEGGSLTNLAPGGGTVGGPAPASIERHAATLGGVPTDNPPRAALNTFVLGIAHMDSVVLKPVGQFVARPTQRFPQSTRKASLRQAVALVAAAAANGVSMDGQCVVPRRVTVDNVDGLVENGVACDIITSGMATLIKAKDAADEMFSLNETQARQAVSLVGLRKCLDLGILRSDALVSAII